MSAIEFNNKLTSEITVEPAALEQLIKLTENEDGIAGVRVFINGGGCSGMTYGMTFIEEPSKYDCVLENDGLNLYIDSVALSFLEGMEIDYKAEGVNKNFVFRNVFANTNSGGSCGGCGGASGG